MNRSSERTQRRSTVNVSRRNNSNSAQESSSSSDSNENLPYTKNSSTPVRSRWTDTEAINRSRSRQSSSDTEDTEEESSDEKELESPWRRDEETRGSREKRQDERVGQKQKGRHDRRGRRRHDKRSEDTESEQRKETSPHSSGKRYGEGDADHSKRKSRDFRDKRSSNERNTGENELPITEILKRSQENARTKYEDQPPLPELTTDKIYVQYRDGFSAMKISRSRGSRAGRKTESDGGNVIVEKRDSPPIGVAIRFQQCSKSIGLVFQGLLGGMALMHYIMLHVLFEASMEFVIDHSTICEIYANIFSFCIALCIVSTLDKFDLARFDMYHLREIYSDYNRAVIAIPLYLIVFCLHQISSGIDNRLASVHHYSANDTVWENVTGMESLVNDLTSWQKISMSKDILAIFAWLFVSLSTKDDAFLIHLRSMEKYANDVESSQR